MNLVHKKIAHVMVDDMNNWTYLQCLKEILVVNVIFKTNSEKYFA